MIPKPGHFVLEIEIGNVGMMTLDDLSYKVKDAATKMKLFGIDHSLIKDGNGNTVGAFATDVNALEDH